MASANLTSIAEILKKTYGPRIARLFLEPTVEEYLVEAELDILVYFAYQALVNRSERRRACTSGAQTQK